MPRVKLSVQTEPSIAYFSMEIALENSMPTYAGGLGVLAGDTIRSAADLEVPMVAVTLLHRKGYFYQRFDPEGRQVEESAEWAINDFLEAGSERVSVDLEGRPVALRCWRRIVKGITGFVVPVLFLDSDLEENSAGDRTLTHFLYGGDRRYRLLQEAILGMGGVRMLDLLGYRRIERYHMNEGHAALLTLELLDRKGSEPRGLPGVAEVNRVRRQCVFTTHTPVPSGHDQYPLDLVHRVLGRQFTTLFEDPDLKEVFCCEGVLNMTYLALNLSHYVNGVAKRHREVSRSLFPAYPIDSITNGIHCASWASDSFRKLFDLHIPDWRADNFNLRYAIQIPIEEIWEARRHAKRPLLEQVNRESNAGMDQDVLTLGFARRFTGYKRPDLLFHDVEELKRIAREIGPLQIVFAGKAHPNDEEGKSLLRKVLRIGRDLREPIRFAFLENYDVALARLLCAGVDVWLNTPDPPHEAS